MDTVADAQLWGEQFRRDDSDLSAVEPPLWCRLIGGYARDRGFRVQILDSEALNLDPAAIAEQVKQANPWLVGMIVFGHQPSASTQQSLPDTAPQILAAARVEEHKEYE